MNSAHSGVAQSAWFSFMSADASRARRLSEREYAAKLCRQTANLLRRRSSAPSRCRSGRASSGTHTATTSSRGRPRECSSCSPRAAASYVLPPSRALWIPAGTRARDAGLRCRRSPLRLPRARSAARSTGTRRRRSTSARSSASSSTTSTTARSGAEERSRAEARALRPAPAAPDRDDRRPAALRPSRTGRRRRAPRRSRRPADAARVGTCRRREQPHPRARLSQRHRPLVRALAHARPPAGLAPPPRRADAGEHRRAAVGYRTTSAYVAAFRAHTGVTPGRYFDPPSRTALPHGAASGIPVEDRDGAARVAALPSSRAG